MRLTLHVRPRSSATEVGGDHDGALVVRVAERAEGGRANQAVIAAIAQALGVPQRAVTLVRGASSRRKVVEIEAGESDRPGLEKIVGELRAR